MSITKIPVMLRRHGRACRVDERTGASRRGGANACGNANRPAGDNFGG
ncbi:MAG TPA: hypothetical protein IAB00_06940 [Candidatus Avidehalobacter gallistercoris]|uniref:Uncharacterized protein n=1 Tax=Candidatus Avidehalobacter gallistercoris TaxID=2840694 RepID=A0A9D1HKV9_9FIRM|nr:hypothetical protein [Candidatus Avidehalobacter gallistercoris]